MDQRVVRIGWMMPLCGVREAFRGRKKDEGNESARRWVKELEV